MGHPAIVSRATDRFALSPSKLADQPAPAASPMITWVGPVTFRSALREVRFRLVSVAVPSGSLPPSGESSGGVGSFRS
jgi:hypothetical protein